MTNSIYKNLTSSARLLLAALAVAIVCSLVAAAAPAATWGVWLSRAEASALPATGAAWDRVRKAADSDWGAISLFSSGHTQDTSVLAGALVYAKTGDARYREKVGKALAAVIGTDRRTDYGCCGYQLGVARNLAGFAIAADLIDLDGWSPTVGAGFRNWLAEVRFRTGPRGEPSLAETQEKRANNFGTHASAARVAASFYLGDIGDVARAATVFRGWLGDRSSYAGFSYGSLDWQCNASAPVGVNPAACTRSGHSIDGVLADDQRRGGEFTWPPPKENYVWEALQGATAAAQLLSRAGYPAWQWQDGALRRAVTWLHQQAQFPAAGDDTWVPWLVNFVYGTRFPTAAARVGKNMAWTDWTHATNSGPTSEPAAPPESTEATQPTDPSEPPPPQPEASTSLRATLVADASVKSTSPSSNYGGRYELQIRLETGDPSMPTYRSYLKFAVSGLAGGVVASATLRLYVTDESRHDLVVRSVGADWSEESVTWANAPAPSGAAVAGGKAEEAGRWVELALPAALFTGDGTYAFVLENTGSNSALFSSREGGTGPQLVLAAL
jgi:hypothetical protein